MVTVSQIVKSIQRLRPFKWLLHINKMSDGLEFTTKANGFIRYTELGGVGSKIDDYWMSNPEPFDRQSKTEHDQENMTS